MRPMASRRASRSGSACSSRTSPSGTPTGRTPGDSGLPTQLQWTLPPGVTAGDIAWPVPKKIPIGTLANYGYEGTVLLPVPLTVTPDFKPSLLGGDLDVKLKASWLVCKQGMHPGRRRVRAEAAGAQHHRAATAPAFDAAFDAQPQAVLGAGAAGSTARIDGNALERHASQGLPAALRGKTLEFFPETAEVIETGGAVDPGLEGDAWTARVPLSPQRSASPARDAGGAGAPAAQGWRAELKVAGRTGRPWPRPAAVSPALRGGAAQQRRGAAPAAPSHRLRSPRCWARCSAACS